MTKFRIVNPKGLFYSFMNQAVMTVAVFEHLRDKAIPAIADPARRAAAQEAIAAVEKLPTTPGFCYLSPQDEGFDEKARSPQYGQMLPCKSWLCLSSAKSSSEGSSEYGSPKEAGWEAIADVAKNSGEILLLLENAGATPPPFGIPEYTASLKKKFAQAVFAAVDDDEEYCGAEAVALFMPSGFLDSKGSGGPLSRARLFESAEAARRTASSRGIGEWQAMAVSITVTKAFDLPGSTAQAPMLAAIAKQEAAAIDKALDDAGVERLRAKLAEIEARDGPSAGGQKEPKQQRRL